MVISPSETILHTRDRLDFIEIIGLGKNGIFSRIISKRLFYILMRNCLEDDNLDLNDLIKGYCFPHFWYYKPYNMHDLEKRGIMR